MQKTHTSSRKLTTTLFIVYVVVLFWILLFKLGVRFSYMSARSINLVPFTQFFHRNGKINVGEIILNIVVFIPLGIYVAVLFKRWNLVNKLFFFFLTSLMIESVQLIFKIGAFDVTDIVTNVFGSAIGLLTFEVIEKLFSNGAKAEKFINVIGVIGTVIMTSLLLLLKLNLLPIRYQ